MKTSRSTVIATALMLVAGCAAAPPSPPSVARPIVVTIDRVATANVPDWVEAGGVVRARLTATIASRVMGPIAAVHVKPGDRVRQGTPLVMLDARELTAQAGRAAAAVTEAHENGRASEADVRAAEAALRLARASYDRIKTLHDSRSATPQEFDEATTALTAADARLSGAQARAAAASAARTAAESAQRAADAAASYAVLTAPFDGSVAERFVDPGTMASPGVPLLVLEDASALRLEVQLDEARAGGLRAGQEAETRIDAAPASDWCPARISEVARLNATSHNVLIKVDLARGASVRTGAFGRARFASSTHRAVTVADGSLVRRGQLTFVYAVTPDGVARLRPVVAGASFRGRTEALAGVADSDLIVSDPSPQVIDGARVTGARR